MMGWIWGALGLGVISLVVFLSFWGWVTRNKSLEDIEREKTQTLLLSIKEELKRINKNSDSKIGEEHIDKLAPRVGLEPTT